ncbi:MAG: RagB/SusD family nutrient uptake outer membrane protein [Cyclobacteriaceae bacterium]|nr:MAG: RagB/SusD family nutrient uptake outer membrane protein [Cyclobacteriaceae bacterium]
MKNLIRYTLFSTLLFTAISCDLDEEILGDYTKEFDPANQGVGIRNNVNKPAPNDGLSAAFTRVLNGTANHGSYFSVTEVSTDEVVITQKGGDWFDGGIWLNMHRHNFSPTVGGINGAWVDTYGGIFQCNDLLTDPEISDGNRAQLRFLRAYFYWRLMDLFGRVKIVTTPGVDVPQSDREDVFDFIESELLAAIPDLPEGRGEYSRASQGAAYALLSRLYLNAEVYTGVAMYDEAIAAADEVINSGVYELSPSYAAVFAPDNVDNIEHIFIAPFDEATGTGMNIAQMTLHYPSQLTFRLQQQPWNGYSTLEDFYNSYQDGDERKENNFIVGPQTDVNGNPILDLAFDQADQDGAEINYTPEINELAPNGSRQAGARLGKFRFKIGQSPEMDNDFPLLRYGEVLLNKAEALARKNGFGDATALGLVNQLRDRADATPLGALTEGELLAERGRELFIESLRRTDLIRFGAWGNAWWEKASHANPNLNVFPIPIEQINASAGTLTQNPGY